MAAISAAGGNFKLLIDLPAAKTSQTCEVVIVRSFYFKLWMCFVFCYLHSTLVLRIN